MIPCARGWNLPSSDDAESSARVESLPFLKQQRNSHQANQNDLVGACVHNKVTPALARDLFTLEMQIPFSYILSLFRAKDDLNHSIQCQ